MAQRTNRTVICSVVFLDIVEYSRKPVGEQIRLKERLNELLSAALADVAANDRIILDTGDGAAISFLGDPEDALFVGISLREALAQPQPPETPDLRMRIGINLGPVKLITDLNDQPNIIGDGINVAQRVMSFADPGQILVSRSYYEVVSCMSDDYVKLFQYEGSRTDKHVREHEVYAVGSSHPGIKRASASVRARSPRGRRAAPHVVVDRLAETANLVQDRLRRQPRLSTALAVGLILATALAIRLSLDAKPVGGAPAADTAAPVARAPASTTAKSAAPPAAKPQVPAPAKPAATAAARAPAAAASNIPATLQFAISPWGEIFVDGRKVGVAPPMRELEVAPGRHRIEVRNSAFPAYEKAVDAQPGEEIKIRHKFR